MAQRANVHWQEDPCYEIAETTPNGVSLAIVHARVADLQIVARASFMCPAVGAPGTRAPLGDR